jgi:hypothetical protein
VAGDYRVVQDGGQPKRLFARALLPHPGKITNQKFALLNKSMSHVPNETKVSLMPLADVPALIGREEISSGTTLASVTWRGRGPVQPVPRGYRRADPDAGPLRVDAARPPRRRHRAAGRRTRPARPRHHPDGRDRARRPRPQGAAGGTDQQPSRGHRRPATMARRRPHPAAGRTRRHALPAPKHLTRRHGSAHSPVTRVHAVRQAAEAASQPRVQPPGTSRDGKPEPPQNS